MQSFTYPGGAANVVKLFYHYDRLGSTGYLTDNVSGKVASFVSYDDWGAPAMKPILRLGERELDLVTEYTGHMYDPLLEVYYARARMYDAGDRRWLSPDPVKGSVANPQSMNLYVYVLDNPIKYIDPFGFAATDPGSNLTLNVLAYMYARGSQDIHASSKMVLEVAVSSIITSGNWYTIAHRIAQVVLAGRLYRKGFGFMLEKQLYNEDTKSFVYADIVTFKPGGNMYYLLELKNAKEAIYQPAKGRKQLRLYFQLLSCRHPGEVAFFPKGDMEIITHKDILQTEYYTLGIRFIDQGGGLFGYQYDVRFKDDNARRKFNFNRQACDLDNYEQFRQLVQWRVLDYQRALQDSATREMYAKYHMDPVMYGIKQLRYVETLHSAATTSAVIGGASILVQGSLMFEYMLLMVGTGIVSVPTTGGVVTFVTVVEPEITALIMLGLAA